MNQRYRARWRDEQGRQREFLFESPGGLGIARIDFRLKLIERHIPRPERYQLEAVPRLALVEGMR